MVWKEIMFGFAVAGFIAVFCAAVVLERAIPDLGRGRATVEPFLTVVENALAAPVVAFFTFIGSMGNVPLAALLWSKGASFGGVMAFLGADLVAATVVWVHAKYHGWALCPVRVCALVHLHGGGRDYGPIPVRVCRPDPAAAPWHPGDGEFCTRPHLLSEHRLPRSRGSPAVASLKGVGGQKAERTQVHAHA